MDAKPHYIHPDQLCIGLYIHLDVGRMSHSFIFSNFEIKKQKQIDEIRALNLKQIRYDPFRSKCKPLPLAAPSPSVVPASSEPPAIAVPAVPGAIEPETRKFKLRANRLMQLNKLILACKKEFFDDAKSARELTRNFTYNPQGSKAKAETIVNRLVRSVITESDVVLHAVCSNQSDLEVYVHSLNVTILALVLAKSLDMSDQEAQELGMAAMFHDIGKDESHRNKLVLYQHCETGARLVQESGLSERIARSILQHHECVDGSGHPHHLQADHIDPLARLLSIVNAYDNLCNPSDQSQGMTPYEALGHMYNFTPQKYDAHFLQSFIRSLGVYPPGSIVQLSNGVYGIVMTTNPNTPLLPFVMIHAPNVPRKTLVIIDLSEEDGITIKQCLKPSRLPKDVFDYFIPRNRVYYYFLKNELPGGINPASTNEATPEAQSNLNR